MTQPKVAIVTGASRGAGAGIARGFGELGYTVYVTGRTITPGDAKGWDGSVLPGTVAETAQKVTENGGKGIAVVCDHGDDASVAKLFEQVMAEQGRLDVLVNNAAYMHHQLIEKLPFWEKELDAQKILDVGLRSAYVASWHAAKIMVPQGSGIIAMTSSFGANCYMHGPAYGAQKAGLDKLAHDMEHDFRGTGVAAVSLWLGPQLTERAQIAVKTNPEQYEGFLAMAENPEFSAHVIDAIDKAANRDELSGQTLIVAEIAKELGVTDRGNERPSHRDMLGSPRLKNPAAVY
ncbi:MAG: short-chain dehydrogenase [Novosphingobium sp. 28-62-57]|uniref:SDR family NAD(P)-dependent oxidoreductase n=1 Tax=unclassified Novosphingobium TaxID=2644732 RepID=UPI000BD3E346|nr:MULTISPECIES: SDR family NAD(P)-dependent oxidoreductase [unclassified Novosphingobium]OYW51458.1 MAG: short-chain dehydrogenase [Novosphingobium sp. 12-62-10]OYZ10407.1 MAG: short-chain dehydrogenase [Novosphingobium sp. 28-62-57]OZA40714.1 MAG: short-chain dehydrogenase [Novosphingobium sp. 17-62-9]HQS68192.1 SDR family NAD(P)-dependent oxidoreductase [Novosphingobium sp.]